MRRFLTAARLEFVLNRFQIVTMVAASLIVLIAIGFMLAQFGGIGMDAACTSVYQYPPGLVCAESDILSWVRTTQQAEILPPLFAFLPWTGGFLIGVPAVSAEIETRTSMLAWTLGPARWRWLVRRVLVLLPLLLILVALPAAALTVLAGVQKPLIDPVATFDRYQSGAIVSVARAGLAFAIGLLVGAWLGRILPSLIISAAIGFVAVIASNLAFPYLMPAVALTEPEGPSGVQIGMSMLYRLPDGRVVDWEGAVAAAPGAPGSRAYDSWESDLVVLSYGYPASAAVEVSLREAGLTSLVALATIGGAFVLVRRRRPY